MITIKVQPTSIHDDYDRLVHERLHDALSADESKLVDALALAAGVLLEGGMAVNDVLCQLTDRQEFRVGLDRMAELDAPLKQNPLVLQASLRLIDRGYS